MRSLAASRSPAAALQGFEMPFRLLMLLLEFRRANCPRLIERYAQHIQGFWIKSCHREIEARFTISVCPLSDITRENIALAMSYAPA